MRYGNTLKGRKKSFVMYGNLILQLSVLLEGRKEFGQFVSMFIAMQIILTYLGNPLACHLLIASVRTEWGVWGEEGFEVWTFYFISIEKLEALHLFCFLKVALRVL